MVTKKRRPEMTTLQLLNRAVRNTAPVDTIMEYCACLVKQLLDRDTNDKPASAQDADFIMALHAMASNMKALARENETLKRKLRRDNRRAGIKSQPELLKKEPEQISQAT